MEPKSNIKPVQKVIKEIIPTIEPVVEKIIVEPIIEPTVSKIETVEPINPKLIDKGIETEGVTPMNDVGGGYVEFNNGLWNKQSLKELRPELFRATPDIGKKSDSNFGTQFPKIAKKGDIFVRVDVLPNRVFKFDGKRWIEQNKTTTQSYLFNKDYIEFLIERINSGEYDLDVLSENERLEIETYLNGNQNT